MVDMAVTLGMVIRGMSRPPPPDWGREGTNGARLAGRLPRKVTGAHKA